MGPLRSGGPKQGLNYLYTKVGPALNYTVNKNWHEKGRLSKVGAAIGYDRKEVVDDGNRCR